jgi:hypothetical protein
MSWQEKAVEAVAKEIDETWVEDLDDARKLAEIVLRAALPLIEVTPGMINVVAANKLRRLRALGELNKGIDQAIVEDAALLFTRCAEEQTP